MSIKVQRKNICIHLFYNIYNWCLGIYSTFYKAKRKYPNLKHKNQCEKSIRDCLICPKAKILVESFTELQDFPYVWIGALVFLSSSCFVFAHCAVICFLFSVVYAVLHLLLYIGNLSKEARNMDGFIGE